MRHKIELFRGLASLIYEWLFTVLIAYFVIVIFMGKRPEAFIETAILLIYIVSYLIRKNAGYNIWIFLVHLILAIGLYFLPFSIGTKWLLIGITVYQMSEAFLYEKRGNFANFTDVPWPTFFVSVIIYAYGFATKSSLLKTGAYVIPLILIIIYLLIIYLDGLKGYLASTKNVSGIPVKSIVSTNSLIVVLIILSLFVGIFLGYVFGLDEALYKALRGLLYVLSYIIFAIRLLLLLLIRPLTQTSDEKIYEEQGRLSSFISGHADDVVGILDIIYKTCAIILVIYILYKAAIIIIRLLMKKRSVKGDKVEEAYVKKRNVREKKIKKEQYGYGSSELKLRKLYRERILRYKYDIRLDKSKTPTEIRDELYNGSIDDVGDITKAYRDVRYGGKKATKDMLRLFDK